MSEDFEFQLTAGKGSDKSDLIRYYELEEYFGQNCNIYPASYQVSRQGYTKKTGKENSLSIKQSTFKPTGLPDSRPRKTSGNLPAGQVPSSSGKRKERIPFQEIFVNDYTYTKSPQSREMASGSVKLESSVRTLKEDASNVNCFIRQFYEESSMKLPDSCSSNKNQKKSQMAEFRKSTKFERSQESYKENRKKDENMGNDILGKISQLKQSIRLNQERTKACKESRINFEKRKLDLREREKSKNSTTNFSSDGSSISERKQSIEKRLGSIKKSVESMRKRLKKATMESQEYATVNTVQEYLMTSKTTDYQSMPSNHFMGKTQGLGKSLVGRSTNDTLASMLNRISIVEVDKFASNADY